MFSKKNNNLVHTLIMEQISDIENCVINFDSFVRANCTPDTSPETLNDLAQAIGKAEAIADNSLRRMIDSLEGGLFLPSTKEEIISIATSCDRIANKCESMAKTAVFQKFTFPQEFAGELLEIIAITHKQFEILEESISGLFSNFGKMLKDHSILDEIRSEETKIDVIEEGLYGKIFDLDVELAKQMQIANFVEMICDISDIIENIADKIQIMLVTRKA